MAIGREMREKVFGWLLVTGVWMLVVMQFDWAPLGKIDVWCTGSAGDAECWFTNQSVFEGRACARAKLVSQKSGTDSVDSLAVCSGRLEPGSTRSIRSPWVKGKPIDVCNRATAPAELVVQGPDVVGGAEARRELSWKTCKLQIEEL